MMVRRPSLGRHRGFFTWVSVLVVLDLATKWLATLVAGDRDRWLITPRVNKELALGVASASTNPVLLVAMAVVASVVFVHAGRLYLQGDLSAVGLAALGSGAFANAIDRAVTGGVHDWFRTGPIVINLADVLIVVGLVWYVFASARASTEESQT